MRTGTKLLLPCVAWLTLGLPGAAAAAPAASAPPASAPPAPSLAGGGGAPSPDGPPAAKGASAPSPRKTGAIASATTAKPKAPTSASRKKGAPLRAPGTGRTPDTNARRQTAGGPTSDDVAMGVESPELRALHDAERELFPLASPGPGQPWPTELGSPFTTTPDLPHVHASGLPPAPVPSAPPVSDGAKDIAWMASLSLPDFPVRWEPRVVRYLEFFKSDPRGRSVVATWMRRSGRYRESIRRTLRRKAVPEDLLWLAMIESGFDPGVRSPVGAIGLWQFMPETGRQYGLEQDRWVDARYNFLQATEAATDFLSDLHRRFGSWDLAIAAYNMGYAGLVAVVRKYNTNDFWALSRLEGALPWETTLYVPKIMAAAIVARNPAVFGFDAVTVDPAVEFDEVTVPPATPLSAVAQAAGCDKKDLEALNLELRAGRTPPALPDDPKGEQPKMDAAAASYPVKVPLGKGVQVAQSLARTKRSDGPVERYVVRFGESVEQIAAARNVAAARIVELNAIGQGEVVRGGTVLLVPAAKGQAAPADGAQKPVVVVPADIFVYPDRRRVFYRVVAGDSLRDVADTFKVTVDEVRRWNEIDPAGRLQEGMTLQLFVAESADAGRAVTMREEDVRTIVAGSDDFFTYWEQKGRKRVAVAVKEGDTLESIGRRHGLSVASMERINRRGRGEALKDGDSVIVYTGGASPHGAPGPTPSSPATSGALAPAEAEPPPLVASPPIPEALP